MTDLWEAESEAKGPGDELTPARRAFLESCKGNPENYLWGKDPETGLHIVRTKDAHDSENPIKPLPDWPYTRWTVKHFASMKNRVVDKPRQMMVSWFLLLWMDYNCLFLPYRTCYLNKSTQDEAEKMLFGRLGVVHRYWPKWFADWARVREAKQTGEIHYDATGSVIGATGENVEDRAARGDQAWIFGVDEAARHPRLREVVAAIAPMARQIILVSTPEMGSPGAAYMNEILSEGREA